MYGDGDSETEYDSNMANTNQELNETELLNDEYKKDYSVGKCKSVDDDPNMERRTFSKEDENKLIENRFSDNFIDIFHFDESQLTEGAKEMDPMQNSLDESDTSSSDCSRQMVYKVNLSEEDIDVSICEDKEENDPVDEVDDSEEIEESDSGDDLFFSSEDVIKNFIDLDDSKKIISENENAQTIAYIPIVRQFDRISEASEEESKNNVDVENQQFEHLQVEKHILKFELSKQLFEINTNIEGQFLEEIASKVEEESKPEELMHFNTQLHQKSEHEKLKINEEIFASLFDYELQQVESIKKGLSVLSHTLTKSNLLKLEQDLVMRRPFSYNDVHDPKTIQKLHRSTSEPILDTISEDENNSHRDSSDSSSCVVEIRPIYNKKALVSLSSHGSQTNITAIEGGGSKVGGVVLDMF